jgi:hypothetical protein
MRLTGMWRLLKLVVNSSQLIASGVAWAATYASHQVEADLWSRPVAYKTFSLSLHCVIVSIFSTVLSQSSASCGGGWLMNSWCLLSGSCCCTGGLLTWACRFTTCWIGSGGAGSVPWGITAWLDPSVVAEVMGLNGCFSLGGLLLVDRLQILTWCAPSEC